MTPHFCRPFIATMLALLLHTASAVAQNPWDFSSSSSWRGKSLNSHSSFPQRRAPAAMRPVQDSTIDPAMLRAARIANERALSRSTLKCWKYVKTALLQSGSVPSYPQTVYAKQAGGDLVKNYGFVKLPVRSAARAPLGAVLVYGGRGAGHVELRTPAGFVSDYRSRWPCGLPFLGAYARVTHPVGVRTAQIVTAEIPRS